MTDAIVLCGGAGLRLRPVTGDSPKSLARVSGRPFLGTLLSQLQRYGFQRVILAIGYAGADIRSYFNDSFCGMDLVYSNESSPLGTGGALRNAAGCVRSDACLAMNGDSYTDVDLAKFVASHFEAGAEASVVVVPVDERVDVGSVLIDVDGNVLRFAEKDSSLLAGHLNAGIYMLSKVMLLGIPPGRPLSLERDLFPEWIQSGRRIKAFVHPGKCVDIGTPERYRTAQDVLAAVERAGSADPKVSSTDREDRR